MEQYSKPTMHAMQTQNYQRIYLQDWKFIREDVSGAWNAGYDDNEWLDVVVPHDWSVMYPFSLEHSSGTGYLPGGTGWYRTHFKLERTWDKVFLTFDGVYKNAQVWFNSYYLGKRPNGYIGFTYDIAEFAREGENTVCVKVTHEDIADSRWFTGSGIYRKVTVTAADASFIPLNEIFFTYDGNAVQVSAPDSNADAVLTAPDGTECRFPVNISYSIKNPQLWSPDTPYLYNLHLMRDGNPVSEVIKVGLRTFRFDAKTGFFLNSTNMKMRGVCVHHDAGCLGAAAWPDVWRRRLKKLKDVGCNAIRMSHNPHMPELYDLCDELGFLVMDEAFDEWEGVKNKWSTGHNVYPPKHYGYYEDFPEWHERDMEAFIRRNRNHASVIMWSIGNEIDYPNDPYCHPLFSEMAGNNDKNKPAEEMLYNPRKPNAERLSVVAKNLTEIVRRHDDTRPVLIAAAFPELSSQIGLFDAFDIIGYNYKEHLYETDHKRFPDLPILGSENGHDQKNWEIVRDTPYISAQFLWTGIDFLGEAQGWPIRGSQAGLLDTAGFEKPRYYERQAMWTGTAATEPDIREQAAECSNGLVVKCWNDEPTPISKYRMYQYEVFSRGDKSAMIHVTVRNGILLGIENGDLSDCQEYALPYRRLHNGRAIVYVLSEGLAEVDICLKGEHDKAGQASF